MVRVLAVFEDMIDDDGRHGVSTQFIVDNPREDGGITPAVAVGLTLRHMWERGEIQDAMETRQEEIVAVALSRANTVSSGNLELSEDKDVDDGA